MQISLRHGTQTWFDVDNITIHYWASAWTGREIVTVRNGGQAHVVSDTRGFGFKTRHEFDYQGCRYALHNRIGFGKVEVELYRNGVLIDSDLFKKIDIRINAKTGRLDWAHAIRQLVLPLLGGIAVGVSFGYLVGVVLQ
ncbi:MAG: hypothetical protein JJT93_02965 [Gammaproteobacteria bacterium]|nr:hypothetical protein [Gammaproteobacteria bacterium]